MSGDTVDQLYNAVHADGAVTGTREDFRKFFLAPGKQGYQNRLKFYNALHADGAVTSGTYEEFAQRLGLHARPRSKAVQQAVAYKPQVPNNFGGLDTQTAGMSWLQRQNMTQKQKAASEKRKAASRAAVKGNIVGAGETVTGQKAATPHVVKRNPNKFFTETQLGNSDLDLDYGDSIEGRIHKMEDDKRNAAALLNSQLTKEGFDQIDKAFAEMAGKEIQDNMNVTTDPNDAMGNLFGAMRGANQKYGTDAVIKAYEEALPTIFGSDKSRKAISEQARKLGMDEEEFTQKYMLPNIEKTIHDRLVNEGIPKSDAEYFARGVLSGIAGNIFTRGVMTKQGREIMNEGTEKYLSDLDTRIEKDGVFSKAGLAKYGNIGMGMASDIAAFAGAGKIAGGMMSGLGTGVNLLTKTPLGKRLLGWAATSASGLTKRYGVEGAARIANFASNNKTWLGTLLTDGAKGTLRSGLTLGNYGAMQYATGEGYDKLEDGDTNNWLGGLLNNYSDEFKTGLKFGVVGAVGSTVGRNVGITGAEASNLQKITNGLKKATVSTGAFVAESLAFRTEQMAEEWAKDHDINFTDNFIQGACENMAMKLGGGHIKQFSPKNILRSMTMATGDRGLTLTDTEKKIFLENTDARNLVAACEALEPNHKTQGEGYTAEDISGMKYEDRSKTMEKKKVDLSERDAQGNAVGKLQQFLDNKEIPLKLRMKVSAALGGTMGRRIPRASRIVLEQGEKGKYMVKEYSESGELIDAKEHSTYDSAEGDRQDRYLKRQDRDFKDEYLNAMDVTTQEDKMNVMELVAKDNGFESVEDMIHESALRNSQGDDSLDKKIKADYKKRREEYAGTKAKKVLDIQREVSEEYGVDLDKAMDKDFQLRTDQENEAIEEFKKRLRGENTDKNDEAQNNAVARQDGADLSEQTELEDSERFTENAKTVNDRQASATEAWMEMVKNNPDLEEWMKSNPNASVEELRENFGDDVADAYMELSNAQAMRDGFMQNTGSKIEDAVRNQVEQAKFTGTMQGMGSEDRIFVFIDSTGNEYTLVGGDVVFDQTDSRFKTGESGLVILRDKDGNIVQDKRLEDLYFTNYYSYEEYADVIKKRLQEQKTAEIQSTETPLPEAPKEEAPAEGPKEEPEDSKTAYEKEKSSDSNKTTDTATVSLKGDTALSQSEESSSNDKDTTKSSDLQAGNETLTFKDGTEAPANYDLNDIPMDDNGEPIYESVPKERTVQDLFGKLDDGNLAREYSEMRVSEAEKELKEAKKKEPKMGTKINEYLSKKKEYEERVKAAEGKVAYWESVKEDIEKLTHTTPEELKEAKEELDGTAAREEFKKTFDETQPADGVALAAKFVADAKVTPESFKKETGMGAAEHKSFVGMIAKEEKGGKSIERLGEDLVQLDNDEYGGVYFHGDSNDARSAIISALTGAKTRKGLREMAEPDMERTVSERAQMRDEAYNERYGMDYEEYLLYSEQEMPHILGNLNNFDEQKYLQDKAVDIINQLDKEYGKVTGENDSRGEESVHVEGDKVLSEERPNDGGGGESPEKHGGREKDERRSDTTDAPLHETPSRREGGVKSADPSDVAEGMREAAEQFHQERVEKARKAYEDAKAIGDTSETKRTKDEYRKALDDKLKAQGIGLVERRKTIAKQMKKSKTAVSELRNMRGVYDVSLDRDGIEVGARGVRARIEFKENESADAFKKRMAGLYDQFAQDEKRCANYNMDASAVYGELKDLTCKLADMTEDEMRRYLTSNNGVRFRDEDSKLNSEDSEKLFASLQNKKGKEYYDTVTELANRVKQGRARTMRLGEEVERKGMESFPLSVFRLLATSNKNLSGAFRSSIETRPDTMEEREPSAETIHSVNLATQKGIIDWAKENGYKFDEPDIKKDSFDGKAWNEDGWESTIYRSKDGKSVIKYTPLSTLYNNPTLRYLDRTMCFNHIFPDTAIDVIGFGYDNDGQFSMVTKQPLIEGKTLDKYFNGDDAKIREYTDNFLKELGYTQKTLNEEGYEADSNGKFVLFDLNKGNIIIDKEGKPHVIDCEVLPVGYDKINSFEIKDDAAQGDTRFRNEGEMTPEERREESRLEEHRSTVEKAAKKLNTDVTICESIDDVTNAEARAAIERGERVKAWYDTRTGEVHLYLPNVTDKYDAQKSIAHEVIGHKGMRGLLGEDGYRTMLRRMYTHLSDTETREVNERMMRNGWDFYTAMDEWVADKAEESVWQPQENPKYIGLSNLWSHIKKSVTEAMHKAGYYINPNVDDVKYWLWESKRALRDGNAETEMRRNAFLWKLGHEEMNDDVVMGEYTGEGEAEREMEISTLFRSTSIDENKHDTLEKRSQKQQIDDILKSSAYRHTEAFGDSDISLKTTIEVMSKGLPDGMNDSMNFYDGNNQLSSVVFDRMEKFMYTTGKQLNDVIRKCRRVLGGKDRDFDRLNLYAIVKHGLERNRWLYVRKAAEALDKKIREMNAAISKDGGVAIVSVYGDALKTEFLDFAKRKREELYSGGISYGDYLHALDGFIKDYAIDMESIPENERGAVSKLEKWFGEHFSDVYTAGGNDYSGLRGIEELRTEDGIDDAAAIDRVSSMENELGEELTRELWTNTKSVTFAGLEWQYKHGLISKKQFEQTQELFAYYVPLRGFSKETMEDQYAYMRGGSGEGKGSLIMKAEGRKSLSVSPFSTALYQTNIAIERASRNQNNQRAWRFALAWTKNNTEIGEDGKVKMKEEAPILISDVWYKKDEDGVWEVSAPEITEGMSADEVRSAVEAHESEMRSLQAEGKAKKRLTDKDRVPFGSAFEESSHRNEHVVDVWMNGERKRLIFMNPKAAQALNGELNKGQTDSIYRYLRKGLRNMSSLMTTYNATFAGRNFIRDYQFANDNVFIKEGRAYWLQMCKNQMRLLGERVDKDGNVSLMHVLGKHNLWFKLWRDYRNDVAPRTEVERYFKEFMENGGRTGFNEALKVDKLEDNLRKASEAGNAKNFALHMLGGMGEVMDYLNERAENFNRFATYMTSRQTGRSVMRSIADAKNVTVNFNRRGAGSKAFGDRASRKDKVLGFVYDYVGSNHVFVNAAIQGYRIFAGNLRHHPVKTLGTMILPPMIMGQVVVPMLNAWLAGSLFDEEGDPYATLSDWDRRNNICLYSGKGKWVKIPLAIEHRAFYGMGDLINAYTGKLLHKSGGTENGKTNWLGSMANESLVTPTKFGLRYGAAYDFTWGMIRQMLEIAPYNPVGSNGNVVSNVVFGDYISPVVEAARNEDWAGKPIYKDTPWNKDDPEWQRVFNGENAGLVYLSKKLNDWSLGDDYTPGLVDINPALVSHFITSYLGGAATDIIKLTDLAANFTEGAKEGWQKKDGNKVVNTLKGGVKNTRTDDVAIVRGFYSMPTEKTKYYRALNKYATYKKYLEAYGERMDKKLKSDNVEFVKEANAEIYHNGVDMQRFHILDAYEKAIRNAIKYRNGKDVSEADKAIVDEDINMMKMEAVKEMEAVFEAKPIKKKR